MSDVIYGKNPIFEAIKAEKPIEKIILLKTVAEKPDFRQIIKLARENKIPYSLVDKHALDRITGNQVHQGMAAILASREYSDTAEILKRAQDHGEDPFLVVLNEVQDPHNLGSIIRTAEAAGVHGIIIPKRRSAGLTSVVAKASAGAVEHLPVAKVNNIASFIDEIKKKNIWVAGADEYAKDSYLDADLKGPIALVMGGESKGLGTLVREKCDFLVRIPIKGKVSSLNVGISAGILIYEVVRQRQKRKAE